MLYGVSRCWRQASASLSHAKQAGRAGSTKLVLNRAAHLYLRLCLHTEQSSTALNALDVHLAGRCGTSTGTGTGTVRSCKPSRAFHAGCQSWPTNPSNLPFPAFQHCATMQEAAQGVMQRLTAPDQSIVRLPPAPDQSRTAACSRPPLREVGEVGEGCPSMLGCVQVPAERKLRVKKTMPWGEFQHLVAERLGLPVPSQRCWIWSKRQNGTYR